MRNMGTIHEILLRDYSNNGRLIRWPVWLKYSDLTTLEEYKLAHHTFYPGMWNHEDWFIDPIRKVAGTETLPAGIRFWTCPDCAYENGPEMTPGYSWCGQCSRPFDVVYYAPFYTGRIDPEIS